MRDLDLKRRAAAELCLDCPEPAQEGRSRCTVHLATKRKQNQEYVTRKQGGKADGPNDN